MHMLKSEWNHVSGSEDCRTLATRIYREKYITKCLNVINLSHIDQPLKTDSLYIYSQSLHTAEQIFRHNPTYIEE